MSDKPHRCPRCQQLFSGSEYARHSQAGEVLSCQSPPLTLAELKELEDVIVRTIRDHASLQTYSHEEVLRAVRELLAIREAQIQRPHICGEVFALLQGRHERLRKAAEAFLSRPGTTWLPGAHLELRAALEEN